MEATAAQRGLPIVDCMVASSYYKVGVWLSVTSDVTGATKACRVTDVTKTEHIAKVRGDGIILEFGAANILEMCNFPRVNWDLPSTCPVRVRIQ
jgi:hypothetical protein